MYEMKKKMLLGINLFLQHQISKLKKLQEKGTNHIFLHCRRSNRPFVMKFEAEYFFVIRFNKNRISKLHLL